MCVSTEPRMYILLYHYGIKLRMFNPNAVRMQIKITAVGKVLTQSVRCVCVVNSIHACSCL